MEDRSSTSVSYGIIAGMSETLSPVVEALERGASKAMCALGEALEERDLAYRGLGYRLFHLMGEERLKREPTLPMFAVAAKWPEYERVSDAVAAIKSRHEELEGVALALHKAKQGKP